MPIGVEDFRRLTTELMVARGAMVDAQEWAEKHDVDFDALRLVAEATFTGYMDGLVSEIREEGATQLDVNELAVAIGISMFILAWEAREQYGGRETGK